MQADIIAVLEDFLKEKETFEGRLHKFEREREFKPQLTKAEKTILIYLAERGEGSRYEVRKDEKIPYSVVHGAFKRLSGEGLIRMVREDISDRNRPKSVYASTAPGLLFALFIDPKNSCVFEKLAGLFPVLKKADFFQQRDISYPMAYAFFNQAVMFMSKARGRGPEAEEREIRGFTKGMFEQLFFEIDPGNEKAKSATLRLIEAIRADRDLSKLARLVLERDRQYYSKCLGFYDDALGVLHGSQEKPEGGEKPGKRPRR